MTQPRRRALLDWYADHRRDLPWRGEAGPWRVLVSEVMLQQTQVPRVIEPYRRFLARFPTADDLAASSVADVLAAWQGLGYNRRALRLREAAMRIAADGWPDPDDLASLPGVGPYTATAVACFAFGRRVAAPDTNARRVLSRWHGRPLTGAELRETAAADLAEDAAAWNQALMDLGASVCLPRNPACDRCPVASWCADPRVYEPPRTQGRFEGSAREARGAVIRHLVGHRTATVAEIAEASGIPTDRIAPAADALVAEGMVEDCDDDRLRLPE